MTILKLTNPKGAVIIKGRRFERNTLGQGNRIDSLAYSCKKWANEDLKELRKHSNLSVEVLERDYK
jgi:hypothetical protein